MVVKSENEDLRKERQTCTFNPLELTFFLDGGRERYRDRKEIENFFFSDPELKDPVPYDYLSHKDKYERNVHKTCLVLKKTQVLREKLGYMDSDRERILNMVTAAVLRDGNPFGLNTIMFIPVLLGQGTPEQQDKWVTKAANYQIIGTYAQTELGHGTFIRGLETTAHYDPKKQEFILNTPTLSSYKWWPGGMGHTANYAVVMAQLYTQGVHRGPHLFIVQLRDEETHMPMPGIKLGEIGTKLGLHAINNGYLALENVRIPREYMLMKNSKVLEDGSYVKPPSSKLAYGGMMFVRVVMLHGIALHMSQAVTIAVRYSAVRRQSEMKPGEPEPQVIDYLTQQYKLFPNLAAAFAIRFSASWLLKMYIDVTSEIEGGSLDRLPELHALASCLKPVCTVEASQGVETCRLACGGHGYMTCSNFPTLYGWTTAACTYEGENTVLLLQTARYLMKAWQQAVDGTTLTPTVAYLKQAVARIKDVQSWDNSMECIIKAFQQVAAGVIKQTFNTMAGRMRRGTSREDAWNLTSIELAQCAEAHARAFIVEKFVSSVAELDVSMGLKKVMAQLCELYVIYTLLRNSGSFLMYSNLTARDIPNLQSRLETLLTELRPNAVGLVDGFDYHDEVLSSTLGAWDGQVYERLYESAQKSPLNKEPVNASFNKYLKSFLKSNL